MNKIYLQNLENVVKKFSFWQEFWLNILLELLE